LRLDLKVFLCISEIPGSKSIIQNLGVLNKVVCILGRKNLMRVCYCLPNKLSTSMFWIVNTQLLKVMTVEGYFKFISSLIDKALA